MLNYYSANAKISRWNIRRTVLQYFKKRIASTKNSNSPIAVPVGLIFWLANGLQLTQIFLNNEPNEKRLATNHEKKYEKSQTVLCRSSFKNIITKTAMDWLADFQKSAKPKTSTYNQNQQCFRASFVTSRNSGNLKNDLCHHFFSRIEKHECIAEIKAQNVTVKLN